MFFKKLRHQIQNKIQITQLEAFCYSLMVGLGESFFIAFALFKNVNQVSAGLLSTIPMVVGALIQLSALHLVRITGSHKNGVILAASIQSFVFLGLIFVSMIDHVPVWMFFLLFSIYWSCSYVISPLWNFWMSHIVSEKESTHFFSQRNWIIQIGVFVGLMVAGFTLQVELSIGKTILFILLFLAAMICRFVTIACFRKQSFDLNWKKTTIELQLGQILKRIFSQVQYQKFFGFLFIFYIGIFISSSFVHTFFLAQLKMSYLMYSVAIATLFVTKIVCIPFVKNYIEKYGAYKVFIIGAAGISPLPALWSVCQDYWFVILMQSVSGVMWAAFETALAIILFNQIKKEEKTALLTVYNLFNALAILIGTLIGGSLLKSFGTSLQGYYFIFIVGALFRSLVVIAFTKYPLEAIRKISSIVRLKNYFE